MSGICGSTNDSQRTCVAAMAARGADDYRTYTDFLTGVSLGVRRESIRDNHGARQPVANEDGSVWTVVDGEVCNHLELRDALFVRGHRFVSRVDTEVVVHLYEESGSAMVDALEGAYVFALWDARRKELLIVRDRLGEKPLFYAEKGSDLFFASELDVLLAGIEGRHDLDPASSDASFVLDSVEEASIVHDVKQLPPGHVLRWNRRRECVQVEAYRTPTSEPDQGARHAPGELVAPGPAAA
jgi:asparagine synthase (glutamine-hydrolysing)